MKNRHATGAREDDHTHIARAEGVLTGRDVTFRLAGGGRLALAVGEVVMTRANDYRAWLGTGEVDVLNGRRGYVEAIDTATKTVTMSWRDSAGEIRTAELGADYIAVGGLEHGYAMTVHKAQGQTADHVALLGDGLTARSGYTGLTRHRESMRLFLPGEKILPASQFSAEDLAALPEAELTDLAVAALVDKARAEAAASLISSELTDTAGSARSTDRPLPADTAAALATIANLTSQDRSPAAEPALQPDQSPAVQAEAAEPVSEANPIAGRDRTDSATGLDRQATLDRLNRIRGAARRSRSEPRGTERYRLPKPAQPARRRTDLHVESQPPPEREWDQGRGRDDTPGLDR